MSSCCHAALYTTSMTWKIAPLLPWWQGSSSKYSNCLCKLFELSWLILPGINCGALTGTVHPENVLSHACLMLLEVLGQFKYFFFCLVRLGWIQSQFTLYTQAAGDLSVIIFLNTLIPNFPNTVLIRRVNNCHSRFLILMDSMCFLCSQFYIMSC